MNALYNFFIILYSYFFRLFPLSYRTGIIEINHPSRNSPVFITGNYALTVIRVLKALRGVSCYLLVANSKGINVWCGATGGHFTSHSIISILKVSGIERRVDHRIAILPQLAATGIEKLVVERKTKWKIIWGPVYAKDIPRFLENDWVKEDYMRKVTFTLIQRIEMAIIWAIPFSIIGSLFLGFVWPKMLITYNSLIWSLALLIYIFFPFYQRRLNRSVSFSFTRYSVLFDFSIFTFVVLLLGESIILIITFSISSFSWVNFLQWSITLLLVVIFLSMDIKGSTPIYKSTLHKEAEFNIFLDEEKCKGLGYCEEVCPRGCFILNNKIHKVKLVSPELCVRCGACIVQCSLDALSFKNNKNEVISPEVIRKYKLNLLGERIKN